MKKFIFLMMFSSSLLAAPDYELSYESNEDGTYKVALFIDDRTMYADYDKCYGTVGSVDGLTEAELLTSTLWEECFSDRDPIEVIGELLRQENEEENLDNETLTNTSDTDENGRPIKNNKPKKVRSYKSQKRQHTKNAKKLTRVKCSSAVCTRTRLPGY